MAYRLTICFSAISNKMATSTIKGGVESGTISGALGHTIQWRKRNGIVELEITNDTTRIPNGETLISTLPTDLKPKLVVHADCYRVTQNQCSYIISPSTGKLSIYCEIATGSSSPYYLQASIVYVL